MKNYLVLTNYINVFEEFINDKIIPNSLIVRYDLDNYSFNDVIEETSYISLFNDKKTIIVTNYNQDNDEKLLSYLEHPNENVLIIISINKKLDERKKTTKRLRELLNIVDHLLISNSELVKMISNLFNKWGILIEENAINLIINKCLGNYDIICNECNKLMVNAKDKVISLKDAEMYVSSYVESDIFKIKELIVSKNVKGAIISLDNFIAIKEDVIPLISLIAKDIRLIYIVKNKTNMSDDELSKLIGVHPYPIKLARGKINDYTNKELVTYLKALSLLDVNIKSGIIDKNDGLRQFIYNMLED